MPASRKIFLLSLVVLASHFVALAVHSTIANNVIESVLIVLVIAACFQAAGRSTGYARRFWRLMAMAFALYALGEAMETYYESVLHASFDQWWPSDILFLFHFAPMAVALFLGDERPESRLYRWQHWLDFLQIGIVSISAYFFFLYYPILLPHSQASIDILYAKVTAWRAALIAVAFVLRAVLNNSKLVKSLFGRMAVFLVVFGICEVAYDYVQIFWNVPFGTWYELLWTIPRTLMIWLAATWNPPEETAPVTLKDSPSESLLLAQFAHIAFPLLVLLMATRAAGQQLRLAIGAVLASFGCSSVRLLLNQRAQNELLAQQKRSAESLRAAEAQFRGLLESAPDPMVVVNREGRIVLVNEQAEKSFAYLREELLGQSIEKLVPKMLREIQQGHREGFLKQPETRLADAGSELFAKRKDGSEFPAEISLSLLETEQGPWVSAAIRDLTERRKLENQFRQAQKMESVGTLAGGIAHDFNNLLTVILSYSSSLAEELAMDPRNHRAADQIHQAAERGAALTRQMLAFSRQQVFQLQVINLNDIIRNLLKMLQRIIGEHIEMQSDLADDLGRVKADPGQFEQVLMNLCVNARDAMPKGGRLRLETRNVVLDANFVDQHSGGTVGPHVCLMVSDTGIGMDGATLARIFEPFFTTKEVGQGTGLGLAMVYGVIKQSGGSIWAYSELGRGTTFKIYLPQEQGRLETPASKQPLAVLKQGVETILLVEDDPAVRELVCTMLNRQGYAVLAPEHPRDVKALCAAHSGDMHMLLTDMVLPGVSGQEVAAQVRLLRPNIKVLYMSGYTDTVLVQGHGGGETTAFIQKPFSRAHLAAKIREVLDGNDRNLVPQGPAS